MATNSSHPLDPKEHVPWQNGPTGRGGISIILACLAVIGTCTWTTLHLTVPKENNHIYLILRKIKWMAVMVVFPEYVFAHAVLELKIALDDYLLMAEHADAFSRMNWTVEPSKGVRALHKILSQSLGKGPPSPSHQYEKNINVTERSNQGTFGTNGIEENGEGNGEEQRLTGMLTNVLTVHQNLPYSSRNPDSSRTPGSPHSERKVWTLTHSYFANIGGIKVSYYSGRDLHIVQTAYIARTPESSHGKEADLMRYICLTESEIMDKSKADNFVKILWVWEILRLIIEIAVRALRNLPITQLEIITVSFAAVSLLTVFIQTKKPKDVIESICFLLETQTSADDPFRAHRIFNGTPTIGSLCNTLLRTSEGFTEYTAAQATESGAGIVEVSSSQAARIPNDYYRGTKEDEGLFFAMLGLSTVIFGAIHCGAWNFSFPTVVEKWVWRGCAVAGLILPVAVLILTFALRARERKLCTIYNPTRSAFFNALSEVYRLEGTMYPLWDPRRPAFETATHVSEHVKLEHTQSKTPISTELSSALDHLVDRAKQWDKARDALFRWSRVCERAQYPGFVVYLLTRLALIGISISCFRSAPRGIYWGTWANFLPTIR